MPRKKSRKQAAPEREPDPMVVTLVERARAKGLSPFALSRAMGMHPSVLNRWRNGTSPRLDAIRPYFEFLERAA